MLLIWQIVALLSWLSAMLGLQLFVGRAAGLKATLLTGLAVFFAFKPLTNAIFGTKIGDDDSAMAAGIFWAINGLVWLAAFVSFYFVELSKRHAAANRNRN